MAWYDEITQAQRETMEELKRRTIDECSPKMLEDDYLFYRFSKARDFDIAAAETMLRKHIAWRKEYRVDTIQTNFEASEMMKKYTLITHIGFDNEGSSVHYVDLGRGDIKGILHSCKKRDLIKYVIQVLERDLERLQKQTKKLGKPVINSVYIVNNEGLEFSKISNKEVIDIMILAIKMYQDNYPERIKSICEINVSFYFTLMYSMLKNFIAAAVLQKISIFGTDGWQKHLHELMDPNELPAFLGGDKCDSDGDRLCSSYIIHGQPVPETFYLPKSKRTLSQAIGVEKLNLTPFAKTELVFEVQEPDSMLEWEFETKNKDIAFGIYFKRSAWEKSSKPIELIPKQRINTCFGPETGMYKCEKSGKYILLFDNSYSWIRSKEIYYRAKIIGPNTEENAYVQPREL